MKKTISTVLILFAFSAAYSQKATLEKLDTSRVVILAFTDSSCTKIKSVRAFRQMQIMRDSATKQLFAGEKVYWDEKRKPLKEDRYFFEATINWK